MRALPRFPTGRTGQALLEYALILTFVAIAVIATLMLLGPKIANVYQNAINEPIKECFTPGEGGTAPGQGGEPPGQCRK